MQEASVYSILVQTLPPTDKCGARLLYALNELAGRLEAAESSGDARSLRLLLNSRRACNDLGNLQLPDPATGPLPLFAGACEHEAMQAAAEGSSKALSSTADRRAWRSWVMSPQHMVHVVEAAWLLVALVFRQEDVCAPAVQAYVCQQVQQHHLCVVLSGGRDVPQAYSQLWTQVLADAACRLLRAAFPAALELHDKQLQQALQRQRLYTTGLLPSDAAVPGMKAVGHYARLRADDTAAAADHTDPNCAGGWEEAEGCKDADANTAAHTEHAQPRRHVTQFVSVKPGAAVSSFLAQRGLQPAPELMQAHAGELTRITLPAHLVQQQQQQGEQQQQHHTQPQLQTAAPSSLQSQLHPRACDWTAAAGCATGEEVCAGGSRHKAKAAACMNAAAEAVEVYERRKAAAAASVKAGCLSAKVQVQALQKQRTRAIAAGLSRAKETSNRVSGWLTEAGATTVVCCNPVRPVPLSASQHKTVGVISSLSNGTAATSSGSARSRDSDTQGRSRPLPTDLQCKAQRHLLEGQLRAGDWRMAHAFNAALHDRSTNMAAAVATLPPAPVTPMPPSGAAAAAGQDWGALVSTSIARSHVGGGGRAGVRCSSSSCTGSSSNSSSIKVMKAARAIVEDVQRAFAAPTGGRLAARKART